MKKLIQRQKVSKYLKTPYQIIFIPRFEGSEPVQINSNNFENYKEQCGDWYVTLPLKIGDYLFLGNCIAKIIKLGKRNAKVLTTAGEKEKIPLETLLKSEYNEIKVKIPSFSAI